MTLGPAAMVCAFAEGWRGRIKDVLVTFGRVPFAFYVMALFPDPHPLGVVWCHAGICRRRLLHRVLLLPEGLRSAALGRLRRVGIGAADVLALGALHGRLEVAQPRLVAQLRVMGTLPIC